jgi:LysM repeat protein
VYVVRPGDTLFSIALRYGVTIQAIMSANGLFNPNLVFVGQSLRIP